MIVFRRWHPLLRREIAKYVNEGLALHPDHLIHNTNPSPFAIAKQCYTDAPNIIDPPHKDKTYVDRLTVTARAGNGGNGCISFWQSNSKGKYRPADGGNGGDGGNIILRASNQMKSLAGIPQLIKAENGQHGQRQKKHGKRGRDTIVLVPLGTVVHQEVLHNDDDNEDNSYNDNHMNNNDDNGVHDDIPQWLKEWRRPWIGALHYTSDSDENNSNTTNTTTNTTNTTTTNNNNNNLLLLGDLVNDGQELIIAHGGHGGRGNAALRAVPNRPAPSRSLPPHQGQTNKIKLELKLIADIALVGFPNVGKSSLLRCISNAQPRVANYSFTTKEPQLGVIEYGYGEKLIVADVPGLIQGAHENRGLGHTFLRHVERTAALVFVVDASDVSISHKDGSDNNVSSDNSSSSIDNSKDNSRGKKKNTSKEKESIQTTLRPWEQVEWLRYEIGKYSKELLDRPWMVVANKIDKLKRPGTILRTLEKKVQDMKNSTIDDDESIMKNNSIQVIGVSACPGGDNSGDSSTVYKTTVTTTKKSMHQFDELISAMRDVACK